MTQYFDPNLKEIYRNENKVTIGKIIGLIILISLSLGIPIIMLTQFILIFVIWAPLAFSIVFIGFDIFFLLVVLFGVIPSMLRDTLGKMIIYANTDKIVRVDILFGREKVKQWSKIDIDYIANKDKIEIDTSDDDNGITDVRTTTSTIIYSHPINYIRKTAVLLKVSSNKKYQAIDLLNKLKDLGYPLQEEGLHKLKSNICKSCGFKIEADAQFCPECGMQI